MAKKLDEASELMLIKQSNVQKLSLDSITAASAVCFVCERVNEVQHQFRVVKEYINTIFG